MVKKLMILGFLLTCILVLTASQPNTLGVPNTVTTVDLNTSSSGVQEIVALSASKSIYVTAWDVYASGTSNVSWVYGTGTNCATGQNTIAGPYAFIAQTGMARGTGFGAVIAIPSGNALCVNNGTAVQIGGSVSYQYGAP